METGDKHRPDGPLGLYAGFYLTKYANSMTTKAFTALALMMIFLALKTGSKRSTNGNGWSDDGCHDGCSDVVTLLRIQQ